MLFRSRTDHIADLLYRPAVSDQLVLGRNIRGALIGQGVHASHGTERTHVEGLEQTLRLIEGYLGLN